MWLKYARGWLKHNEKRVSLTELIKFKDYENYCYMLGPRILTQLRNELHSDKSVKDGQTLIYKYRSGVYFLYNKNTQKQKGILAKFSDYFEYQRPKQKTFSLAVRDINNPSEENVSFQELLVREIEFSLNIPGHPIVNIINNFQNIACLIIDEFN